MRVAVLGAGGLGSKMGGLLAKAGEAEVWLIHRRAEYVETIRGEGLRMTGPDREERIRVHAAVEPSEVGEVDFVLVLVKAYDTDAAALAARPLLGARTLVVTFQNGLGNLEVLADRAGAERAVLGVTFQGATLVGPGVVADMGQGPTYLAAGPASSDRLTRLAKALSRASIPTEVSAADKVDGLLWGKLAMVAGINPLAAILRVPNGALAEVEEARAISLEAIRETKAVAEAKGIELAFDPLERFEKTTAATRGMASGTLLDALRGHRTEVDAISGAIAAEAERLGVPTPVNQMLWRVVKAIEATHVARSDLMHRIRL